MGNFDPMVELTNGQIDKATKFLASGSVGIVQAKVYEVIGETGTYLVTVFPEDDPNYTHTCTCPRIGTCSHIYAAMLFDKELDKAVAKAMKKMDPTDKKVRRHLKAVRP